MNKKWECYETDETYPMLIDGQITKIYADGIGVKVSNGEIVLTVIQPEGKKRMNSIDFVNGYQKKLLFHSIYDKVLKVGRSKWRLY